MPLNTNHLKCPYLPFLPLRKKVIQSSIAKNVRLKVESNTCATQNLSKKNKYCHITRVITKIYDNESKASSPTCNPSATNTIDIVSYFNYTEQKRRHNVKYNDHITSSLLKHLVSVQTNHQLFILSLASSSSFLLLISSFFISSFFILLFF